jgi:hypothetical protein
MGVNVLRASTRMGRGKVRPLARALWAILLATAALGVAGGAIAAPDVLGAEAGVNVGAGTSVEIADVRALGTHWVRMFVAWPEVEPSPGAYSSLWLAAYERLHRGLPAGTKVILDVVDTPRWESGSSDVHAPPANPNDYAAFVGGLAQRLAGQVTAYEIWNEEDEPRWWIGAPNPAAYAHLLQAAYPAIKRADPHAAVILGGLTGNDYTFLEGVYQNGGKGSFDAVGVHTDTACNVLSPYDFLRGPDKRMIADSFLAYREVHATMLANGDDKPIWMTELSWRTTSARCSEGAWAGQKAEGVTPQEQATLLSQAYHCLAQDTYVPVALWFPLQDARGIRSGLVRTNGTRKPAFASMRAYVQHGDRLNGPCGVVTGPKIAVLSPGANVRYSGPLPIHVVASSPVGVFRITLRIDGKLIRNYGGRTNPARLSGFLRWQGAKRIAVGRHRLTFVAYDRERNVSETSVTIYHRPGRAHSRANKHRHAKTPAVAHRR